MYHLPQHPSTYDEMFKTGGYEGVYDLPYRHSQYYGLLKKVLHELEQANVRSVLEVGCGSGAFAEMLFDRSQIAYRGFDFSSVGVAKAIARTNRPAAFFVGDALSPASYDCNYDAIVCTEVLEHVDRDLEIIGNWRSGALCVCSVPDFDDPTHVRYFTSVEQVRDRYVGFIDIEEIIQVKRPAIANISLGNRLRELRWNRHRPTQMLRILGIGSIEQFGCWYLLVGRRR